MAGLAKPATATAPIAAVRRTCRRVNRGDRAPNFPNFIILVSAAGSMQVH
jgi:hypothetical protein